MIRSILLASVLSASLSPLACTVYTLARSVDANVGLETARATLASNPDGNGTVVATAKATPAPEADDGCFATCIAEGNADPSPAIRNLPASEKAEFCADYCEGQQS